MSSVEEMTDQEIQDLNIIIGLRIENKKLKKQLAEFVVFGTDECYECEKAGIGEFDYNRITLFYKPSEHDLHIKR